MTNTTQANPSDKGMLFEFAKQVYGLHCAIRQLANIPARKDYREKLILELQLAKQQFEACGGIIEIGRDVFNEAGPILSYPDPKEEIPYGIGRMICEQLLNF